MRINRLRGRFGNKRLMHFIGQDYYHNNHSILLENEILKNPRWYTAYTPYQSEISQGRLELTHNYQEIIKKITGNEISNSGLLDHSHSLFEAIRIIINSNRCAKKIILVDKFLFDNLKAVLDTYNNLIFRADNVIIKYFDFTNVDKNYIENNVDNIIGSVIFSSDKYGFINKDYEYIKTLQSHINTTTKNKFINVISGDLMHHLYLPSHKDLGANISIGNIQRMGLPLFAGGPHGGYMCIDKDLIRKLPGKLVGISRDTHHNPRFRLALQTREQHIKKNNATSNICTNQALMSNYIGAWILLNGSRLSEYKDKIINYKEYLKSSLNIKHDFIDTITFTDNTTHFNMFQHDSSTYSATFTDQHCSNDIDILEKTLTNANIHNNEATNTLRLRSDNILSDDIFHRFDNEFDFQRYLRNLELKDFTLVDGMIPLGSCTMKYNDIESVNNIFKYDFKQHPYERNKKDYVSDMERLKFYITQLTGFPGVSLQPLSGSHAELTALLMMKKYANDIKKNVILVPESAHRTNPASVVISGCKVVKIKHNSNGSFDINNLRESIDKHKNKILGAMITHPSTYGFFDDSINDVISNVKDAGGMIYLDGANMNSWVGNLRPNDNGFDMMHINMHKTFAIPHGGGGPGVGVLAVNSALENYLPKDNISYTHSIGNVSSNIFGNSSANLISLKYIEKNINNFNDISNKAVENANYLKTKLDQHFTINYKNMKGDVAHELILDLSELCVNGISENDFCKRMIDYGIHPPTMSWPVPKCIMIEPTETENLENLNYLIDTLISIKQEVLSCDTDGEDNIIKNAPHSIDDLFDWKYSYDKNKAYFPLGKRTKKFWKTSNRIDDLYGDKLYYK